MRGLNFGRVLAVLMLALLVAGPAAAQDKEIVVAGAWAPQYFTAAGLSEFVPLGLTFNVAGNVLPKVQIVGDIGFARKYGVNFITATGGVRYVIPMEANPKAKPFVEGLVGIGSLGSGYADVPSLTGFAFGLGGGVDVKATDVVDVRLQFNYFLTRKYGVNFNEIRFAIGVSKATTIK
jgi:hypothetical protein